MWLFFDLVFFVAYVASVILVCGAIEKTRSWYFKSGHPCTCPTGRERWRLTDEERERCPRHNPKVSARYDNWNMGMFIAAIVGLFVVMLEISHMANWGH